MSAPRRPFPAPAPPDAARLRRPARARRLRLARNLAFLGGLAACGGGGGSSAPVDFRITNLQVVQSIQTFANTLPLVAYKPTFVRVSLRSNEANHGPWKVSARLAALEIATSQHHVLQPVSFDPDASITASPTGSHTDRWDDSFTFLLDYGDTTPGDHVFTARVFSGAEEANPPPDHLFSYQIRFHPYASTSVYGVVWAETALDPLHVEVPIGPAAPWSDFERHRRYVESAFPVTHFDVRPIPGIGTVAPVPQPFTTITGANTWASQMVANLPAGSKLNLLLNWYGVGGFAFGRVSEEENAQDDNAGTTMAQEFAHTLGIWCHTSDPCGPATYPRASGHIDPNDIGFNLSLDYGHVIELVSWAGERDVFNALTATGPVSDFMSYNANPLWISSFTYCQLVSFLWAANEEHVCIPGVHREPLRAAAAVVPGAAFSPGVVP
jgi:hypothetical protein